MQLPRWTWLLLLASCTLLSASVVVARSESALTTEAAYQFVKTADRFAIGGIGVAGTISRDEKAFRQLLQQPDALGRCQRLLSEATPAGQFYALLGLRLLDQAAFRAALPRYKDSMAEIPTIRGCIVMSMRAAELARQIEKGDLR